MWDCLPPDRPLDLGYAYTTTAHSAEGLACDQVLYTEARSASQSAS
ncbi:MAG TPA: hypothetical protein VF285_12085 [Castellaniella sp.]